MNKVLISHPFGNQNVRHAAMAFAESNLLAELWVGAAWDDEHWVNEFLPSKMRTQLQRRSFPKALRSHIRQTFLYEATRMMLSMLGLRSLGNKNFSVVSAHEHLDKKVAARLIDMTNVRLIYGYDHCALETFKVAEQRNIRRVLELPIPSWRGHIKILQEEMELHSKWRGASTSLQSIADAGDHKDEELSLAETVIVASDFTKNTLLADGYPIERIRVVPYGAPPVYAGERVPKGTAPLKVLFVGGIGLLKGVPYLLRAVEHMGRAVTLTLIGRVQGNHPNILKDIKKHTWYPSLPHHQVLAQMHAHDVLVFPSLYEGFGLVILEALSQGLPVISTANTGATHVIEDGENGFIVPIRSADAIAEKLEMINRDRDLLNEMRQGALAKAVEYSWQRYRNQLSQEMDAILGWQL